MTLREWVARIAPASEVHPNQKIAGSLTAEEAGIALVVLVGNGEFEKAGIVANAVAAEEVGNEPV